VAHHLVQVQNTPVWHRLTTAPLAVLCKQVSESKLDFQTAQAEWEVKLQALRQDKATAEAQLRRALVRAADPEHWGLREAQPLTLQ
jgi:hypothetical protein